MTRCLINGNRCIKFPESCSNRVFFKRYTLMKARRQGAILEIVDDQPLHSQEELRRRLLKVGFDTTQAMLLTVNDLG